MDCSSAPFADYAHYEQHVAEVCAAGGLSDFSYLWWDVRPNPRLGTVEVRIMDAQSSVDTTAGLAALVQALVIAEAEAPRRGTASPAGPEAVAESCFRAARDGLDAGLWDGNGWQPARELAAHVLTRARGHGPTDALEPLDRLLREGGGASRQREAFSRDGLRGVLAHLVADTAAGAERAARGRERLEHLQGTQPPLRATPSAPMRLSSEDGSGATSLRCSAQS